MEIKLFKEENKFGIEQKIENESIGANGQITRSIIIGQEIFLTEEERDSFVANLKSQILQNQKDLKDQQDLAKKQVDLINKL